MLCPPRSEKSLQRAPECDVELRKRSGQEGIKLVCSSAVAST